MQCSQFARFASLIVVAATLACDSPAPAGILPVNSGDDVLSLQGTVALNPTGNPRLLLRAITGEILALFSEENASLNSIVGAQVVAQGHPFGVDGMYVESFLVLAVNDQPVRDGVLVRTPTGEYALNLTAGEYGRRIVSPSPQFQALVGHRIWVTGPDDGPPDAFGVIW